MKHALPVQSPSAFISTKVLLILTLTMASLYSSAQDNCSMFAPPVAYGSGGQSPFSIVTGDFNKDGKLDMMVVNDFSFTPGIGVLLGNGDGTFADAVTYSSGGTSPSYGATADFNGDGNPDLAVTNYDQSNIGVLLGNGDGTFADAVVYSGGDIGTYAIITGDFNGDGNADLAVTNYFSGDIGKIGVLLGNGDGTFADPVIYGSGGKGPAYFTTGDFNKDGKIDIAVANLDASNVGILLGNGDGTFADAVTYSSGGDYLWSIVSGDFNGDSKTDLAVANYNSDNIGVLLGNGNGTFAAAVTYDSGGGEPSSLATGDLNSDGKIDLAVANFNSDNIGVLLGNGNGTFAAAVTYSGGGRFPYYVAAADFNKDSKPDLAVANTGSDNIGVLLNILPRYYADADKDGYGDPHSDILSCTQPANYVTNNSDCNDGDKTVYPGAPELCDGKDNNCDGHKDEGCPVTISKISIDDVTITEGNSGTKSMNFTVTLSKKCAKTVKVDFHTINNSATAPSDYSAKSGMLTFPAGVMRKMITISIKGDRTKENNETFKVVLNNAVNATIADNTGIGTILNDDGRTYDLMTTEENSSGLSVSVAPNPATNLIRVQLNGFRGKVMLQLMNAEGRVFKAINLQTANIKSLQQQFNIADVAGGTYFIVALDEKGNKQTKKVVVTH